jgi:hypothetical protein
MCPADTFTTDGVGIIQMGTGNDNNTWGTIANNSGFQIIADALCNTLTETVTGGTLDLSASAPPAAPSQVHYAAISFNGTLTSNQIVKVPNLTKWWMMRDNTSGAFTVSVQTPSGSPVALPHQGLIQNNWVMVYCDGNNNIFVSPYNGIAALMPNGSATFPSLSFNAETNSGWYRNGSQDIRLAINGADALQVASSGLTVSTLNGYSFAQNGVQLLPAGTELNYGGVELPGGSTSGGFFWADGSAYSRTTYANLFNATTKTCTGNTHSSTTVDGLSVDLRGRGLAGAFIEGIGIPNGTYVTAAITATSLTLSQPAGSTLGGISLRLLPYGQGDALTTFNVRDARYRHSTGRQDMNGNDSGRSSLFAGKQLGAAVVGGYAFGEEAHVLGLAELPNYAPTFVGNAVTPTGTFQGINQTWNLNQGGVPFNSGQQVYWFGAGNASGTVIWGASVGTLSVNVTPAGNLAMNSLTPTGGITSINGGQTEQAHNTQPPTYVTNVIIKW